MKEENIFFLCMEIFLCMFSSVSMLQISTRAFNVFNLSSLAFKTNSQTTENNFFFSLPFPKSPFAMQMLGRLIVTQILWQILNLLAFPVEKNFYIFDGTI